MMEFAVPLPETNTLPPELMVVAFAVPSLETYRCPVTVVELAEPLMTMREVPEAISKFSMLLYLERTPTLASIFIGVVNFDRQSLVKSSNETIF